MVCSKCNNTGELKVFNTFQYYYCHTCKEEILLEEPPASFRSKELPIQLDVDYTMDYWLNLG